MRRLGLGLLAALTATTVSAQMSFQRALPNAVEVVRDADDFLLIANLFTQAGAKFDPEVDRVMAADQVTSGQAYLSDELDVQKAVLEKSWPSVAAALTVLKVTPLQATSVSRAKLTFEDQQLAWSTAISPEEIRLGARFLRGLVIGSLREAANGNAGFSQSLASFLGISSTKSIDDPELERRARLYFAAARNGVAGMRYEDDFDEHFRRSVKLLESLRVKGGETAIFVEMETRLTAAANGGEISGADGMAMLDVFMRLNSHFRPALSFVFSHELGHIALGHVPFPTALTCEEKRQREHDADAFAVALLIYDVPGDTEVEEKSLFAIGVGERPDGDDERLGYGYEHAIRYGFARGGLTNAFDPMCSYPGANERVHQLDQWRSTLIARRLPAYEASLRSFRKAPPYVYFGDIDDSIAPANRAPMTRRLYASCRAGLPSAELAIRKLDDLPFGYAVACHNRPPADLASEEFRLRLGTDTAARLLSEYEKHVPSLMSDTVLKLLQSNP